MRVLRMLTKPAGSLSEDVTGRAGGSSCRELGQPILNGTVASDMCIIP